MMQHNIKGKLLWLDDYRDPFDSETDWMMFSPIGRDVEIHWVKSANEFKDWITQNGLPDGICFDHDLDPSHYAPEERYDDYAVWAKEQNWTEETGHHCAHWLVDYCIDNEVGLPKWSCQSANPSGRKNIDGLLFSYLKHTIKNEEIEKKIGLYKDSVAESTKGFCSMSIDKAKRDILGLSDD